MKYIKYFEGRKNFSRSPNINKPKFQHHNLYPISKEEINEMYEYLDNIGANPKAYKITPDLVNPKRLGFDLYNIAKDKDYLLYFEPNDKVPGYITNRSFSDLLMSKFELDEKKEEEMKLYLINKKYNL